MKKKKGKKFWAIVGILVLLPVIGFAMQKVAAQRVMEMPLVETSLIEKGSLSSNIYTSGIVRAKNSSTVSAELSGRISAINFEEGDLVSKGDVVVSLGADELNYAIKEAELNLDLIKNRESSELSSAKRAYEEAKEVFERNAILYDEGAVSKSEYEASERLFLELRNEYEKIGTVSAKQIELEELRLNKLRADFEKTEIVSPASGTLTNLQIEVGGFAALNQPLFTIQDFDELEVLTQISEYDISRLEIGQKVFVRGQGSEEAFDGRIDRIAPDAMVSSSGQGSETVVEVVVEITEKTEVFKPNFSAELQILTGSLEDALLIPYESVYIKKGGEKVVYLLLDDNLLEEVPIKSGMEGDLLMEIIPLDGSKLENKRAVLNPTENLKDGMKVRTNDAQEEQTP
ncbi:MAG: efflux RND transporter periplasmic adaptor subunit [Peptostreptococcaceae bacterium]|nr:efflux RND transporter periplasmic adaptor subunit [Peptostreptococcaceae bacterium]